jgi:hypothetical protein
LLFPEKKKRLFYHNSTIFFSIIDDFPPVEAVAIDQVEVEVRSSRLFRDSTQKRP